MIELSPSTRPAGRVDIIADGEHLATLTVEAVSRLGLRTGAVLDDALRDRVAHEAAALATYDRAVNMLAAKARAVRELRLALLRKGEPEPFVDEALERLIALGHLDDARFARQFARSRAVNAGFSRRRIQAELARRGVPRRVADEAIAEVMEEEGVDESAALVAAARIRLRALGALDPAARRRRLYAWLLRRGFAGEDVARAIDGLLSGEGATDDDAG